MKNLRTIMAEEGFKIARRPYRSERDDIDEQYGDVPRNERGDLLPAMGDLKKVKMVVIGPRGRYAAPELNREGKRIFKEITGSDYDSYGGKHGTPRHHPALVWIAQTYPGLFAGGFELVPVPGGVYKIREYDGSEWLETPQSVEWTKI